MNKLPTLTQAAKLIGVSRKALFAELRRLKIIDDSNIASHQLRSQGLLVEQREFANSSRSGNYWVTVVTDAGLIFLQGIADAMAKNGQVVVAERNRPSDQRSAGEQENNVRRVEPAHESLGYAARPSRGDGQPRDGSTTL